MYVIGGPAFSPPNRLCPHIPSSTQICERAMTLLAHSPRATLHSCPHMTRGMAPQLPECTLFDRWTPSPLRFQLPLFSLPWSPPSTRWPQHLIAVVSLAPTPAPSILRHVQVLYQINPAYRGKWEFNGLRGFLEGLANPTELRDFFTTTLPYLQRLVLKTPELFPEPIRLLSAGRCSSCSL